MQRPATKQIIFCLLYIRILIKYIKTWKAIHILWKSMHGHFWYGALQIFILFLQTTIQIGSKRHWYTLRGIPTLSINYGISTHEDRYKCEFRPPRLLFFGLARVSCQLDLNPQYLRIRRATVLAEGKTNPSSSSSSFPLFYGLGLDVLCFGKQPKIRFLSPSTQ